MLRRTFAKSLPGNDEPVDLERHLLGRLHEFGITRIADTSGLDRLGIPTHSCVRPSSLDHIWVYSGKGISRAQSRVSAVLEAIERTSALWDSARVVNGPASAFGKSVSPDLFSESFPGYKADKAIAWVEASRIGSNEPILVPADLVFSGRRPRDAGARDAARGTSNGLACSTSLDDALMRAMLEVIERDAVSFADLRASAFAVSFFSVLRRLLKLPDNERDIRDDPSVALSIDLQSLPPRAATLADRFKRAGLELSLMYIPSPTGIPTVGAATLEQVSLNSVLATAGYASRLTMEDAAVAALLELAQSRATDFQGSREDCHTTEKARMDAFPVTHWMVPTNNKATPIGALPDAPRGLSVTALAERLRKVGAHEVAYVEFPTYVGVRTVRVLAPGLETWHATHGHSGLGVRLSRLYGEQQ